VKVIGIIGYKKTGKTTLGLKLSKEFSDMGYRVGVIKHAGHLDFLKKDTAKFKEFATVVAAVSPEETEVVIKGKKSVEEMLKYFDCDIVVAEGFKTQKTFPKILCIKNKEEEKELSDGLELFTASFDKEISDFDIANDQDVRKMAVIAFEKAFKLPGLDCSQCGYESCYYLAREIVGGKESVDSCISLNPPVNVEVDGQPFPLNHYTSNLFKNIITAMVSSLKGFRKGKIKIEIP